MKLLPPAVLLEPVQIPAWSGKTNGDLLEYAQDLEIAVEKSNSDKAAIRVWAQEAMESKDGTMNATEHR